MATAAVHRTCSLYEQGREYLEGCSLRGFLSLLCSLLLLRLCLHSPCDLLRGRKLVKHARKVRIWILLGSLQDGNYAVSTKSVPLSLEQQQELLPHSRYT